LNLLEIPFSPHVSDFQPRDPGQKFSMKNLSVFLVIGSREIADQDGWSLSGIGEVQLYGRRDHPNTMVILKPGEWVRIIGQGVVDLDEDIAGLIHSGQVADHLQVKFGLYREEILITASSRLSWIMNPAFRNQWDRQFL
jgi:hypothetical protein